MALPRTILTVDEFDQFAQRPENADKQFEFIAGEIFEVVSNDTASYLAGRIIGFLFIYLQTHPIGRLLTSDGGFMVSGERYIPDVSFMSYKNHPKLLGIAYRPNPPDLAVEVVSSTRADEMRNLTVKVSNYLAAGSVVWVVHPTEKRVDVHVSGQPVKNYHEDDIIPGGDVLPDFELPVKDIFADAE